MGFAPTENRRLSRRTGLLELSMWSGVAVVTSPLPQSLEAQDKSCRFGTAAFAFAPDPEWLPKFDFHTVSSPESIMPLPLPASDDRQRAADGQHYKPAPKLNRIPNFLLSELLAPSDVEPKAGAAGEIHRVGGTGTGGN
jgi:hypothetical protein